MHPVEASQRPGVLHCWQVSRRLACHCVRRSHGTGRSSSMYPLPTLVTREGNRRWSEPEKASAATGAQVGGVGTGGAGSLHGRAQVQAEQAQHAKELRQRLPLQGHSGPPHTANALVARSLLPLSTRFSP